MKVRRARPEDAEGILETHHSAVHELASSEYDDEVLEAWAWPVDQEAVERFVDENFDTDGEPAIFVAVSDGRVVGFSVVVPAERELRAVYIRPERARRGLGTALLRQAEWAATDVDSLELDASLNAVPFYEENGYERVREGVHELADGLEMPCVHMKKEFPTGMG